MYIPLGGNMGGGPKKKQPRSPTTGAEHHALLGSAGSSSSSSIEPPGVLDSVAVRTVRRVINIALIFTFVAVWYESLRIV